METDYHLKIVLVGDTQVGKTALTFQYTDQVFLPHTKVTIGVDFKLKMLDLRTGETARLQIWDTSGQERFRAIVGKYYRGSDGLVVVYDVTDIKSFEHVTSWFQEAEYHGISRRSNACLLVGNKTDLILERVVPFKSGQALADSLGVRYIETSARDTTNVEQAFSSMVTSIIEMKKGNYTSLKDDLNGRSTIKLSDSTAVQNGYNNYTCCSYY